MSAAQEGETPEGAQAPGFQDAAAQLRDPDFRLLFSAQLISAFGSAMTPVALVFGVLALTDRPALAGLVVACQTVAQASVQLFGGAVADRFQRKRVMIGADLLAAATQTVVAVVLIRGDAPVPLLMALAGILGIAFALHWPAGVGLVPLVVPQQRLQAANALLALARSLSLGLGAATAGVLVAAFGAGWAIAVDAGTFVLSAALVARLRVKQDGPPEGSSMLQDLREGWHEFSSRRWIWALTLQFTLLLMGWHGGFIIVGPVVANADLGGASTWGFIAGAFGLGNLVGAVLGVKANFAKPMLVGAASMLTWAIPLVLLSVPTHAVWIALAAFVAGVSIELFAVLWFTALQTHVPPHALSRVFAYDILGSVALAPVGEAIAGPLVETIGASPTLWMAAGLVAVPTILVLMVPEVRNLQIRVDGPPSPSST